MLLGVIGSVRSSSVLSKLDNVVTVFPDDLKKYLSVQCKNTEDLISNQIELIDYEIV